MKECRWIPFLILLFFCLPVRAQDRIVSKNKRIIDCKIDFTVKLEGRLLYYLTDDSGEEQTRIIALKEVDYIYLAEENQNYQWYNAQWVKIENKATYTVPDLKNRYWVNCEINFISNRFTFTKPSFGINAGYTYYFNHFFGAGGSFSYKNLNSRFLAIDPANDNYPDALKEIYVKGDKIIWNTSKKFPHYVISPHISFRNFSRAANTMFYTDIGLGVSLVPNIKYDHAEITKVENGIHYYRTKERLTETALFGAINMKVGGETFLDINKGLAIDYSLGFLYDIFRLSGKDQYTAKYFAISFNLGLKFVL